MPGQAVVTIRDKQWDCSVANTYEELTTGLSGVPSIPAGTGMLFILPQPQIVTVTAVGILFPLSVVFISEDLKVTGAVLRFSPGAVCTPDTPCRYFLEVNTGEVDDINLEDEVNIQFTQVPSAADGMTPVITLAGVLMVGVFMAKMGKTMADAMFVKPKKKPLLYGPRGELLPDTKKTGSFVIGHDYMGNLIITHTERPGDVFLQFEAARQVVYDILQKWELKEVEKGWSVQVKDTESRASILDELWGSSAQTSKKPSRLAKSSAVIPIEPRRPRRTDDLEFLPDSPEFLAYTIEDIGYRDKIDSAFLQAIAMAKGGGEDDRHRV